MDGDHLSSLVTNTTIQLTTSSNSLLEDQYPTSLGEIDCHLKAQNASSQVEKGKLKLI